MDPGLMLRILHMMRRHPPVAGISLHLGGEPLLHPEIDALVGLVHTHLARRPRIASNGTLLTEALSRRLVRAGGAHLEIDFSHDPEVFERLRAGASWSQVRDNILLGLAAGLEMTLVSLDGAPERLQALFGDNPRLKYGHFRLHNVGGSFAPIVEERFALAIEKRHYYPCTHLWFSMSVAWNGKVVVCCRDTLHQHVVGDLAEQSLAEVWYGKAMKHVRSLHARGSLDTLSLCSTCDRPYDPVNQPWVVLRQYSPRWKP